MDHVAGSLRILLAKQEGRIWFNIICLKLYQPKRITRWCLFVLESILEYILKFVFEICLVEFFFWKNHSFPNFLLRGGLDKNSGRPWSHIHSPLGRTPYRLFIHEVLFGPLGLHLRVWSELGRSLPFRPMRALGLQYVFARMEMAVSMPKEWMEFQKDNISIQRVIRVHVQLHRVRSMNFEVQ